MSVMRWGWLIEPEDRITTFSCVFMSLCCEVAQQYELWWMNYERYRR